MAEDRRVTIQARAGTLVLDATISESLSLPSEATDSPVEEGSDITDHIRAKPEGITIVGVITDTPVNPKDVEGGRIRTSRALAYLRGVRAAGELVTVISSSGLVYKQMAILNIEVPIDGTTGDSLRFTLQMKQIRTVQSQVKRVRMATTRQPKVDRGAQTMKAVEKDTYRSALAGVFGGEKAAP